MDYAAADLDEEQHGWVVQSSWTEYTEFLESGCDAALLIGMHSMAGTDRGGLSHTVSGTQWRNLWFNGKLVGETGVNAALCGTWGTPVVLVTGDDTVCAEGIDLLGDGLVTVAVKRAVGRFSARHIPPVKARAMIEEGANRALQNIKAVQPYNPGRPCEIRVEFADTDGAYRYRYRAGVEIVNPRLISSRADDWWSAWRRFFL